jgi:hypothetical protein
MIKVSERKERTLDRFKIAFSEFWAASRVTYVFKPISVKSTENVATEAAKKNIPISPLSKYRIITTKEI